MIYVLNIRYSILQYSFYLDICLTQYIYFLKHKI